MRYALSLGVPLVDVFGRSKTVWHRWWQLHCLLCYQKKAWLAHKVSQSIGKSDDYGYRAAASIGYRIRKNTLTPSMKDVLEFYELM